MAGYEQRHRTIDPQELSPQVQGDAFSILELILKADADGKRLDLREITTTLGNTRSVILAACLLQQTGQISFVEKSAEKKAGFQFERSRMHEALETP